MANSITITFSAKDLDLNAILLMYKGEQIHLPYIGADEISKAANQILSSNEDEVPELVRVRATVNNVGGGGGGTPNKSTLSPHQPKAPASIASTSTLDWESFHSPGPSIIRPQNATPVHRTLANDWVHLNYPGNYTTVKEQANPAVQTAYVDLKPVTPAAPRRPLVFKEDAIPTPISLPTYTHGLHTPRASPDPIVTTTTPIIADPTTHARTRIAQITNHLTTPTQTNGSPATPPTSFKINIAIWNDELSTFSKQKKSFDGRSFVKCTPAGKTHKEKMVILSKIGEQIGGTESFWDCVPFECHDSPRPVPEGCGKPFLEHVLRTVVRTKREVAGLKL